jgi:O-antigen/teichoic acid export membrane protein
VRAGGLLRLYRTDENTIDFKCRVDAVCAHRDGDAPIDDHSVSIPAVGHGKGAERVIRSVGLNTFYQVGSQVPPAIAAMAAIPFLLRHLGSEAFGIITLFSTALIYFMILDLGLGRAATRFISQSLESGRPDDVRRYFWGSIILLSGIGLVVTVACLFAVPTVVSSYLKISATYSHAATESFYIICVAIPLVTLMATLRGFLEALGRFPFISILTGFSGVGLYLLPVVVILMGGGIVGIAASYVLVRVSMCGAFAIGCLYVEGRPSLRPVFDLNAVRRMLSFGGWLSVSNIVGTAILYGDRFLLGICVGMTAVASYGMPLDVIGKMQILITSFCAVLFPLMSRLDESGSAQFQTLYRGAIAISLSFMTPLTISAVMMAPFLMKLWLGARNTRDIVFVAQVFLAGAVVQALASIAFTALHARGRSDLTAWVHLAEFPIYCAAFYLAATHFGVRGAALAWLGRAIIDCFCMVVLLRVHKRGGDFAIPPELVVVLVSICILLIAVLPTGRAGIGAAILCTLTWLWTWRTLFDPAMRVPLAKAVLRWREPDVVDVLTNDRG